MLLIIYVWLLVALFCYALSPFIDDVISFVLDKTWEQRELAKLKKRHKLDGNIVKNKLTPEVYSFIKANSKTTLSRNALNLCYKVYGYKSNKNIGLLKDFIRFYLYPLTLPLIVIVLLKKLITRDIIWYKGKLVHKEKHWRDYYRDYDDYMKLIDRTVYYKTNNE